MKKWVDVEPKQASSMEKIYIAKVERRKKFIKKKMMEKRIYSSYRFEDPLQNKKMLQEEN